MTAKKLTPSVYSAVVSALEFIRVAVTEYPKTTENILTNMDMSDEGFDEEIDVLEKALNDSNTDKHERMVPRLANLAHEK